MRNKLFVTAAAALGLAPVSVFAAIFLNNEPIGDFNVVTASNGDILITTTNSNEPPQCTDDPNDASDPCNDGFIPPQCEDDPNDTSDPCGDGFIPPTDPGECGSLPGNVTVTSTLNWAQPGNTPRISLGSNEIKATPFTSTGNPGYDGQVSVASTTGTSGMERRVWISECPNGAPVAHSNSKCEATGFSNTTLRWTQGSWSPIRCKLDTNTSYYLNIRNLECNSSACDVFRGVFTNNNP